MHIITGTSGKKIKLTAVERKQLANAVALASSISDIAGAIQMDAAQQAAAASSVSLTSLQAALEPVRESQ
jgi:hypothetical protein